MNWKMLNNHQWGLVVFIWGQFHREFSISYYSLLQNYKLHIKNHCHISQHFHQSGKKIHDDIVAEILYPPFTGGPTPIGPVIWSFDVLLWAWTSCWTNSVSNLRYHEVHGHGPSLQWELWSFISKIFSVTRGSWGWTISSTQILRYWCHQIIHGDIKGHFYQYKSANIASYLWQWLVIVLT